MKSYFEVVPNGILNLLTKMS